MFLPVFTLSHVEDALLHTWSCLEVGSCSICSQMCCNSLCDDNEIGSVGIASLLLMGLDTFAVTAAYLSG